MKYRFFIMLLICYSYTYAQYNNIIYRTILDAEIIDYNFFNKLDSVVEKRYQAKFEFYNLMFCNKDKQLDIESNFTPSPQDSVYYFMLQGTSALGTEVLVKYKNKKYNLRKNAKNIIVGNSRLVEIRTVKSLQLKDLSAPLMILQYKNQQLQVINDYRIP